MKGIFSSLVIQQFADYAKALSTAVHDNFPNLTLEFVEHNENTRRSYPVVLSFTEVKFIDKID